MFMITDAPGDLQIIMFALDLHINNDNLVLGVSNRSRETAIIQFCNQQILDFNIAFCLQSLINGLTMDRLV